MCGFLMKVRSEVYKRLNRKEKQVEELLAPTVESLGCRVWGVEFLAQGKYTKLRLYIDKDAGVTVDDCASISRHVGDILDVEEAIAGAYTLEVSSPGMDRILFRESQYVDSIGERIEVRLNFPFEGRRNLPVCWQVCRTAWRWCRSTTTNTSCRWKTFSGREWYRCLTKVK